MRFSFPFIISSYFALLAIFLNRFVFVYSSFYYGFVYIKIAFNITCCLTVVQLTDDIYNANYPTRTATTRSHSLDVNDIFSPIRDTGKLLILVRDTGMLLTLGRDTDKLLVLVRDTGMLLTLDRDTGMLLTLDRDTGMLITPIRQLTPVCLLIMVSYYLQSEIRERNGPKKSKTMFFLFVYPLPCCRESF